MIRIDPVRGAVCVEPSSAGARTTVRRRRDAARRQRDLDREYRPLSVQRAHPDRMAEQFAQAFDDREAQTQALASLAGGVVHLMVFFEDRLQLRLRGCRSRCPRSRCATLPWRRRHPTSTLPRGVYFRAFEIRLRIICSSRRGSLRMDRAQGMTRKSRPAACAW